MRFGLIAFFLTLSPVAGASALADASPRKEAPSTPVRIVVLGDSLTDGYGVSKEDAYPSLLQTKLREGGFKQASVVNAGISGSTTASAKSRLQWHLKKKPDILLIALGANDGLRGMKLEQTKRNLSELIELARTKGIRILLAGIQIPPNYGKEYVEGFRGIYLSLAKEHSLPMIPFLLEGVGGEKEMNLPDGIHPNEQGHRKMAENVYPHLIKLLEENR